MKEDYSEIYKDSIEVEPHRTLLGNIQAVNPFEPASLTFGYGNIHITLGREGVSWKGTEDVNEATKAFLECLKSSFPEWIERLKS